MVFRSDSLDNEPDVVKKVAKKAKVKASDEMLDIVAIRRMREQEKREHEEQFQNLDEYEEKSKEREALDPNSLAYHLKAMEIKDPKDLEEAFLKMMPLALSAMADVMEDLNGSPSTKASMSRYVSDRVLGRPTTRIEEKSEIIQKRIIVGRPALPQTKGFKELGIIAGDTVIDTAFKGQSVATT